MIVVLKVRFTTVFQGVMKSWGTHVAFLGVSLNTVVSLISLLATIWGLETPELQVAASVKKRAWTRWLPSPFFTHGSQSLLGHLGGFPAGAAFLPG